MDEPNYMDLETPSQPPMTAREKAEILLGHLSLCSKAQRRLIAKGHSVSLRDRTVTKATTAGNKSSV